jgi:hypothetical protein
MRRSVLMKVCFLVSAVAGLLSCAATPSPAPSLGVALTPGRFLAWYAYTPGFAPDQAVYRLGSFMVTEARETSANQFLSLFNAEMTRAFAANGLKWADSPEACQISGEIRLIEVKGANLRFLRGRITGVLEVAGRITKGNQVLFAFHDRLTLDSPLSPGAAAPKETELLLTHLCREFAQRLLTEMLLQGLPRDSG